MENPLISIILPVINGENYIEKAINSVISQTYKEFELIIIDNGSTDSTPTIIQKFIKTDSRIIGLVCVQKGIVNALNTGIKECKGNYIGRIDSDDIWHPKKLEIQVHALKNKPSLVLLGTSVKLIDAKGDIISNNKSFNNGEFFNWFMIRQNLSKNNLFCHSSIVMRKDIIEEIGGYQERFLHSEDYHLWFRVVKYHPAEILSDKLVKFRIHDDSVSNKNFIPQQLNSLKVRAAYCFSVGNPIINIFRLLVNVKKALFLIITRTYKG